jgi:hypothetical protein
MTIKFKYIHGSAWADLGGLAFSNILFYCWWWRFWWNVMELMVFRWRWWWRSYSKLF